jgi:myo-inositol-1(or 4)-monophosphatase
MSLPSPAELAFVATQAALKAGALLCKGFGTACKVDAKEGMQNLVTEYDQASEKCLIDTILKHFPTHGFLAEESGATKNSQSPIIWIIDPLDGTVNFAHQIPLFSISIAASINKEVVMGIVYQPMTDEFFIAQKGQGAYLNGSSLKVSSHTSLADQVMLATGFPYNVDKNPLHCIDQFAHITQMGIPLRRLGSAAIDLSYVAAGRFDAYWEVSLHPWDMAAGKLLVEEAGGRVSHYDGSTHKIFCCDTLLASNGLLHQEMIHQLTHFKHWTQ